MTPDRKKPTAGFWIIVALVAVLVGCGPDQTPKSPPKGIEAEPGTRAYAVAKAHEEVARQGYGPSQRTSVLFVTREENQWHVTLGDEPPTPGGHCTVVISDDGSVVEIQPGE